MIEGPWSHDNRGYVALSYIWEDAAHKALIEVDGRPFHIARNLELTLTHLRDPVKKLRLQANSIYVNQADFEDRNRHVRQNEVNLFLLQRRLLCFLGNRRERQAL